jgi:hypothetical protein
MRQFFDFLNGVSFPYVVLRNWEPLPDSVEFGDHSDLDLLVYDLEHFLEIIPQAHAEYPYPRVRFKLQVGNEHIFMDVRHVGDGYYPTEFEEAILETREWNEKGFFTPNPIHHRIALAYHVAHHKGRNTYPQWLGDASVDDILQALKDSPIGWVEPMDKSVGRFNAYWRGATATVSKDGDRVIKKQTGFMKYGLLENERRILRETNSIHFPKLYSDFETQGDVIVMEDCGEMINVDNLPLDWKEQLVQICMELKAHNIQHRDIKPENLMIKDGVIKLIDFGWARFYDDEQDEPPSCLGYPFKPSEGWDDNFSMRKIIKMFDARQLEKLETIGA